MRLKLKYKLCSHSSILSSSLVAVLICSLRPRFLAPMFVEEGVANGPTTKMIRNIIKTKLCGINRGMLLNAPWEILIEPHPLTNNELAKQWIPRIPTSHTPPKKYKGRNAQPVRLIKATFSISVPVSPHPHFPASLIM